MFNSRFLCAVYLLIAFDDSVLNMMWIFLATSMFAMQEIAKHFPNFLVHIVSEHTLYWGNTTSNAGTVWSLAAEMIWIVFVRIAKSCNNDLLKNFKYITFDCLPLIVWVLSSGCAWTRKIYIFPVCKVPSVCAEIDNPISSPCLTFQKS